MKKSIATVALGGTLPEKLEAAAAAYFDGVEVYEPNLRSYEGTARDVGRIAADLGLTIDLFQPLRDFEGVPDAELRRNLDRADAAFDVMGELDANLLLVCSNTAESASGDVERAATQLFQLAERGAQRGIRIGYEALAWGRHVFRFDQAYRIVARANHPNLGVILDSFHTLVRPEGWSGIAEVPASRIFFLQLGDAPRMEGDPLSIRRNHSRLPGHGDLDVAGFLRAVLATGYSGNLSIEIFNEQTKESPKATARAGMSALLNVEEQARRGEEHGRPGPARTVGAA
ncbi:MAG TPA: sugar phosphate isomerase/epimerase family protein [Casimicrobiaceae bacterium]|nr:sugar phosphate isomerase/epimerase family protein [Casimicrobiaceae bacterium]